MSYSNYQLSQRISNLQNQINVLSGLDLQQVLDNGDTAQAIITINNPPSTITNVMRFDTQIVSDAVFSTAIHQTDGFVASNQPFGTDYGQLLKDRVKFEKGGYLTEIINTGTQLDINGQVNVNNPIHSPDPINGNDLATKGYTDSLVGQYSGGYNFFFNYSVVDGIYKSLGQSVVASAQQIVPITTDTTNQLVASFVSSALGITSIPSGIWNVLVFSEVASIGGILTYFFEVYKLTGATETLIFTSGLSTDVNATTTPTAYGINGTLTAPYTVLLTDKIVIKIYLHKDGTPQLVNTYFQNAYYSFVQSTLNAGTTILSSNNTFTGTNKFTLGITAPSLTTETAVALDIGTTTATSLNIGRAGINTFVAGNFQTGGIDRATAGTFSIGGANATGINLSNKLLSGITRAVNSFVTLSANTSAPTSTQIGYSTTFSTAGTATLSATPNTVSNLQTFTLVPAGVWLFEISFNVNTQNVLQSQYSISTTSATNDTNRIMNIQTLLSSAFARITGIVSLTAISSVYFTGSSTKASVSIDTINATRTRIA